MNRKKREQFILDAAIRVFARQGYPKTSVSEIIKEADVARGTFYLYFKSKKDIFHALIDRFMMELSQNVAKINGLNVTPEGNLRQQFRLLASDLITTITSNRLLAKIILIDSNGLDTEFDAKLGVLYDQLAQIIRHNLDQNIKAGLFRNCQTDVVARCMIGSAKEIISMWITQDHFEIEEVIQGLIDYLLKGLMPARVGAEKHAAEEATKTHTRHNINNLH